jgi:hypothetical protein
MLDSGMPLLREGAIGAACLAPGFRASHPFETSRLAVQDGSDWGTGVTILLSSQNRITVMRKLLLVLAAATALVSGCATSGSSTNENWKKVRLTTDPELVRGCKFLVNVRDDSAFGPHSVEESLLQQTAEAGGNVLMETRIQEIRNGIGTKSSGAGEAYRCEYVGSQRQPGESGGRTAIEWRKGRLTTDREVVLLESRIQELKSGIGTKSSGAGEVYRCEQPKP